MKIIETKGKLSKIIFFAVCEIRLKIEIINVCKQEIEMGHYKYKIF
jgi:hypothetical protein